MNRPLHIVDISGSKITGNHNPCTDCDTVEKADHQKDEISPTS